MSGSLPDQRVLGLHLGTQVRNYLLHAGVAAQNVDDGGVGKVTECFVAVAEKFKQGVVSEETDAYS